MNCRQVQKRLVDLWDPAIPPSAVAELRRHLAECPACAQECIDFQAALDTIEPSFRIQASPDFKERVMKELTKSDAPARRWRIPFPRLAFTVAAAAALVIAIPFLAPLAQRQGEDHGPVATLLAQSVQAMSNLRTLHITARMRTTPAENFEYIDPKADFVPIEIWREFGNPPRWRVEKSLRVVVMDGTTSSMLINSRRLVRGTPRAGHLDWIAVLLDPDQVLRNETNLTRFSSIESSVRRAGNQQVLTVKHQPKGNYANDWVLNKSVSESSHSRVYYFSADSQRLQGMQLIQHLPSGDVTVFEITAVEYDKPLDAKLFTLDAPMDTIQSVAAEQMPASHVLPRSPKETAQTFFEALARQDWDAALTVYPQTSFEDNFKKAYGGLEVISIGEPFQSGLYGGWFVPYEVRLKSGTVKKHNLAVRNNNPVKRWVFDGGF